jgi:hypothetical protein
MNPMKVGFALVYLCLLIELPAAHAQSRRSTYDSLIVGDRITPAVSSVMMPKGYTEVILNNSLFTANKFFASNGDLYSFPGSGKRDSYFFNTLQITHGLSSSGRINAGIDISYRTGRADSDPKSSPMKVFGSSSEGLINYERAFTSIGLRTRYVPFAKIPSFVVQHTFYIPISAGGQESTFLGDSRYALNSQLLFNQLLGRKMFLFGQLDLFVRLKEGHQKTDYTVLLNVFAAYLVSSHFFPFVQLGASRSWFEGFTTSSYTYGAGLQYQFTTMFNINFFYNDVFAGKNYSEWQSFNLSIRCVF